MMNLDIADRTIDDTMDNDFGKIFAESSPPKSRDPVLGECLQNDSSTLNLFNDDSHFSTVAHPQLSNASSSSSSIPFF